MTYDDFLKDVIEMTEEEYIKVIRSTLNGPKVFLKRTPSEVRVNPYMKIVLSAWKANHDLQFILDPYACAMYIVSYISKSQKGMSALLDQATKEARQGNLDLKKQVRLFYKLCRNKCTRSYLFNFADSSSQGNSTGCIYQYVPSRKKDFLIKANISVGENVT
jgi:hypothetical protein